jgi:aerobic carbon-monoxide dehydrogenase large subunit
MPGVLAVITGADLQGAASGRWRPRAPINSRDGTPVRRPARKPLTTGKVRYIGDPVAMVVTETMAHACKSDDTGLNAERVGLR